MQRFMLNQGGEKVANLDGIRAQRGKGIALAETNVWEAEGKREQRRCKRGVGMLRREDSYSEW